MNSDVVKYESKDGSGGGQPLGGCPNCRGLQQLLESNSKLKVIYLLSR